MLARSVLPARGELISLDPRRVEELREAPLGAVWLGHASVLLRLGGKHGLWVLTDPVFSAKIGVEVGPFTLGVPRVGPAVDPTSLPTPDLVLLSHAHFDHLDRPSLRALTGLADAKKRTVVVTAEHTRDLVPWGFAKVLEMPSGAELALDGQSGAGLRALRPAHWGARTMWDKHRGFNSYVLSHEGRSVLYAGDTAETDVFDRAGPLDLTIFGIGAYDPWIHAHASPEQAWTMHTRAGGAHLLPMHHSTFVLSDEPLDEPMARLLAVAGDQQARVVGREVGGAWLGWAQ